MICPHCQIGTSPNFNQATLGQDGPRQIDVRAGNCTECDRLIVLARSFEAARGTRVQAKTEHFALFPARVPPRPIPPEVVDEYATDFREAALVLQDSPKASAAVSRRLVQHIIREKAGIRKPNLDAEIDAVIAADTLPSDLAHDLDMTRTLGNFAAHPVKSTHTGEIVDVEPGEAEALLDLLEELLDFYFVRPARRAEKRDALNKKLADAGKPTLKGTPAGTGDAAATS